MDLASTIHGSSRRGADGKRVRAATGRARRLPLGGLLALFVGVVSLAGQARADDPEGCLFCHQYRGLARVRDGKNISLFYVDPNYYALGLGPHARLRCTDCHNREEVARTPHRPVTPVDCTRMCHLEGPGKVEKRFAHDRIDKMLSGSIHGPATLRRSNDLLGKPLRAGQSTCLLCHDEPTFRRNGESWAAAEAPVDRCGVCHDDRPATDNRFGYWHVHARSHPARSKQDVVRVCALCHSSEKVRAEFGLPDATSSYLASFHGKAVRLGNEQTAACLDCHVGALQNVHQIQSGKLADAPTNAANLPDTCRSAACHRDAGAAISTAAMHLDLSTSSGAEYFIAVVFVLLILFTFGPSLVLVALKLIQLIAGRKTPAMEAHEHLAAQLMADPRGRSALRRFTFHQRVQHWFLVVTFATLVATGFPMKFADQGWAQWAIGAFGGLAPTRIVHRAAGAGLIAGMFYHLIYLTLVLRRKARESGKGWIKTFLDLPLVMRPSDVKEMMKLLGYLLFLRKTPPQAGRFSAEEKFEYFGVFWGSMLLGITGVMMWANAWTTRHFTGRVLTAALLIHSFEAFLALLHVGVLHIATVIFSPSVFPISKAMFTGDTPVEELAEEHGAWVDEAQRQVNAAAGSPLPKAEVSHG